jgi:hypothetical protein
MKHYGNDQPGRSRRAVLTGGAAAAALGGASRVLARPRTLPSPAIEHSVELTADTLGPITPLAPSGDTTGTTDSYNISKLPGGTTPVILGPGVFYLAAPIQLAAGNSVIGSGGPCLGGTESAIQDAFTGAGDGLGTVLTFGSTWSIPSSVPAGTPAGVVMMIEVTEPPAAPGEFRMNVSDLWIDGSLGKASPAPASTHGIFASSLQSAVSIANVGVYGVSGHGVYGDDTANGLPDGWMMVDCLFQACGGSGVYGAFSDASFFNVHAEQNDAHGFYLTWTNTRLVGCRSDSNGAGGSGDGFHLEPLNSGASLDGVTMIGCSTLGNYGYGLNVINRSTTGTSSPEPSGPVTVSGCTFDGDGATGGEPGTAYAGINAEGQVLLIATGTNVLVSYVGDRSAGGPAYAFMTATAGTDKAEPSMVLMSNCFLNCTESGAFYPDGTPMQVKGLSNVTGVGGGQWTGSGAVKVT